MMSSKFSDRLVVLQLFLGGLLVCFLLLTADIYRQIQTLGVVFSLTSQMYWLLVGMLVACFIPLAAFILTWTRHRDRLLSLGSKIVTLAPKSKLFSIFILILLFGGYSIIVLFPIGEGLGLTSIRWFLFWGVVFFGLILFRRLMPRSNWLNVLAVTLLSVGIAYRLFQFLPDISAYPFSLGWSEASRYYYASLFLSKKIYGFWVPPSTLHPTRYLMQSVPFLVHGLPLWFHRAWQVALWLVFSFGTAFSLARRLKLKKNTMYGLFLAWVFLFMWQGPIYYHLLVIVVIVLWGFDPERFWRSLVVVAIASAWAGISRLNWFPVPGMLAALLYFLEKPKGEQLLWRYLLPPAVWTGIGFGVAVGTQSLYIVWSGNDPELFASSFSSALLWFRLLPNATYPLGILTGTILISLPIFLIVGFQIRNLRLYAIRTIGITAILFVLLIGGLVVSIKIGGGSNLHNMDAYLALLMIVGSYIYFDRVNANPTGETESLLPNWLNLFIVLIPVFISLNTSSHFVQYNPETAADSLFKMQRNISRALEDGGEVLFISERHLLTFDSIEGATLVPEYEKVFLMEMVMAGNRNYLDQFESDIRNQRFDLIITDPLFETYKEAGENWAAENNVWVDAISVPILCNYWRKVTFPESGVQILAPREAPQDCTILFDLE